jgi:hypothetical protein
LSPASPFTDAFNATWYGRKRVGKARRDQKEQHEQKDVWYDTQHEHWLGWLEGYKGPGGYERKNWSRSAEFVYNHIVNPQMLIYLAEATDIKRSMLRAASKAAFARATTMGSMSGAIRGVIPWDTIHAALLTRH